MAVEGEGDFVGRGAVAAEPIVGRGGGGSLQFSASTPSSLQPTERPGKVFPCGAWE